MGAWGEIAIEDEHLRLVALPAKGGEVVSLVHGPTGTELLARLRPVPADDGTLAATRPGAGEAAFNRWYAGGWQGLVANGDAPCTVDGAVHSFHGDAWYRPWAAERTAANALALAVRIDHLGLRVERRIELDRGAVVVVERLLLDAPAPLPVLWGHHPAFGGPLVGPGARIRAARGTAMETVRCDASSRYPDRVGLAWPRARTTAGDLDDASSVLAVDAGTHDLCLLRDLSEGRLGIDNPALGLGVELLFDPALFRWAWIWMLHGGGGEAPFDGACVALEPWVGPPGLPRAIAEGAALVLEPGRPVETELRLVVTAS